MKSKRVLSIVLSLALVVGLLVPSAAAVNEVPLNHGKGRVVRSNIASDGSEVITYYEYDNQGNIIGKEEYYTYGNDNWDYCETYYTYDSYGNIIKEVVNGGSNTATYAYTYDANGKIKKCIYTYYANYVDVETRTKYTYDTYGNITSFYWVDDVGNKGYTYYAYDSFGNCLKTQTTGTGDYSTSEEHTV